MTQNELREFLSPPIQYRFDDLMAQKDLDRFQSCLREFLLAVRADQKLWGLIKPELAQARRALKGLAKDLLSKIREIKATLDTSPWLSAEDESSLEPASLHFPTELILNPRAEAAKVHARMDGLLNCPSNLAFRRRTEPQSPIRLIGHAPHRELLDLLRQLIELIGPFDPDCVSKVAVIEAVAPIDRALVDHDGRFCDLTYAEQQARIAAIRGQAPASFALFADRIQTLRFRSINLGEDLESTMHLADLQPLGTQMMMTAHCRPNAGSGKDESAQDQLLARRLADTWIVAVLLAWDRSVWTHGWVWNEKQLPDLMPSLLKEVSVWFDHFNPLPWHGGPFGGRDRQASLPLLKDLIVALVEALARAHRRKPQKPRQPRQHIAKAENDARHIDMIIDLCQNPTRFADCPEDIEAWILWLDQETEKKGLPKPGIRDETTFVRRVLRPARQKAEAMGIWPGRKQRKDAGVSRVQSDPGF
jgi:hypothetical protein